MKTLELKAYGVQEMNRQEMVETEGGVAPLIWGIGVGLSLLLSSCVNVDKSKNTTVIIDSQNGNSDQKVVGHGSGNSVGNNNGKK